MTGSGRETAPLSAEEAAQVLVIEALLHDTRPGAIDRLRSWLVSLDARTAITEATDRLSHLIGSGNGIWNERQEQLEALFQVVKAYEAALAEAEAAALERVRAAVLDEPLWPGAGAGITVRQSESDPDRMLDYRQRVLRLLEGREAGDEEKAIVPGYTIHETPEGGWEAGDRAEKGAG